MPRTYLAPLVSAVQPCNKIGHATKLRVFATRPSTSSPLIHTTMDMSYPAVEGRIKDAIEAFYSCKNSNRSAITRNFNVPPEHLRSRLRGRPSQSEVQGLQNRLFSPNQDQALVLFFQRLSNASTPARLNSIKNEAIWLLCQDWDPAKPLSKIKLHWAKRWMDWQSDLFKVKRKPLAAK